MYVYGPVLTAPFHVRFRVKATYGGASIVKMYQELESSGLGPTLAYDRSQIESRRPTASSRSFGHLSYILTDSLRSSISISMGQTLGRQRGDPRGMTEDLALLFPDRR